MFLGGDHPFVPSIHGAESEVVSFSEAKEKLKRTFITAVLPLSQYTCLRSPKRNPGKPEFQVWNSPVPTCHVKTSKHCQYWNNHVVSDCDWVSRVCLLLLLLLLLLPLFLVLVTAFYTLFAAILLLHAFKDAWMAFALGRFRMASDWFRS